jgi:serine phosphatase RsbU (regulator of sigma subunit)
MIAKDIQKKLLPSSLPEISGFSLSSINIFADEVGGDYYDCVKLKDNSYCFIIADVSGKGMPAAFYMAQLKGAALAMAQVSSSGAELLKRINKAFYGSMEKKMYITMQTLTINPDDDIVFISRAGHMPAVLKSKNEIKWIKPNGIGIGLAKPEIFDPVLEEIAI